MHDPSDDHANRSHASHSHAGHAHSHAPKDFGRAFAIGVALNLGFVAIEAVFGILARLQKTIFVVREEKRRTGDQVNEIAARMNAGEIVVLFPEGTTSDGNRLLEVKSSLFGAAGPTAPRAILAMLLIVAELLLLLLKPMLRPPKSPSSCLESLSMPSSTAFSSSSDS